MSESGTLANWHANGYHLLAHSWKKQEWNSVDMQDVRRVFGFLLWDVCTMHISEFQRLISQKYEKRDRERGIPATFMWFVEEVGELATALASQDQNNREEEFADVFAWLCTLANISDVDLEKACAKYTGNTVKGFKPK